MPKSTDPVTGNPKDTKGQPALREAALFGLCPRCGEKTVFSGMLAFADKCSSCGLDYSRFNVGDGAAAFVTLIVGALVMALGMWVQVAFGPPWWVQALIWVPTIFIATIWLLRVSKAALLAREFHTSAAEHRHEPGEDQ